MSVTQAAQEPRAKKDWRTEFYEFDEAIYLNVSGQSPIPRVAGKALEAAAEWKKHPYNVPDEVYFGLPNRVRALLAKMLNAQPEEIAITTGATPGMAAVANGLDWQAGDEVLIARGEFPAHLSVWMPLEHAGRLRVKVVRPAGRFLTAEDFLAQITPRTRVISTSLVRFDDAVRVDAPRLAEAVHAAGGYLLLDASQCVGAMPMDARALGADFISSAGYKWLLSPFGTGFFWIRRELIDQLKPAPFYWMAVEGAENFHSLTREGAKHTPRPGEARRWDSAETASFFNLAVMEASLDFILRAGVDTIWQHNSGLTQYMLERLPLDCCIAASPCEPERRGPYACIKGRSPERTQAMYEKLRAAKIYVSLREGALRVAPHLYNSERDMDRLLHVLAV
jgi:selenocysteine lyase/cysteine desulfurase